MADEITLKTVLDHMTAMEQRLSGRFNGVDARLSAIEGRLGGIEQKLSHAEAKLSWQIDAIDKRLDGIEIEKLPKRIARLESAHDR